MESEMNDWNAAIADYNRCIGDMFVEMRCDIWQLDYKLTLIADDLRDIAKQLKELKGLLED